ncbi:MAG: hypothetical protein FJ217_10125 [Ignavibacteria bacterium]|nr:hypothetical protein [Ignavibacteria bacterium]
MRIVGVVFLVFLFLSCEPGLTVPPEVEPGFGGIVFFEKGTWPPQDSLFNLWVFASQIYPLDSLKVFEGLFADPPRIYLYPAIDRNLPLFVDSTSYAFALPPANYLYVGVLQRFASEITVRSLRVVGLYGTPDNPPLPIPVVVSGSQFIDGIDIRVNFHKPPPQPF